MAKKISDCGVRDWTPDLLPDLGGKTYVITGGNSGIGFEAARYLRRAGADVTLACRSESKGRAAIEALGKEPGGKLDLVLLDLADLSSVRRAASEVRDRVARIDGLINNAGIMQTPHLQTADGFEMQLGTNHLGHFLWTMMLLDLVEAAKGRVTVVSSIAHKYGHIHFDDLMMEKKYTPSKAYFQSKLANLMFAFELDRRLRAAGSSAICTAAHPGYSDTELQSTGPTGALNLIYKLTNKIIAQSADKGAIPTVLAAAGVEAKRGGYYGPQGVGEARGRVSDALVADQALDIAAARELWERSEALIGGDFKIA